MILVRPGAGRRTSKSFRVHPAAALLGPRQCGKTTPDAWSPPMR